MKYRSAITSLVVIILVTMAYYVGENRGFKRGVEVTTAFSVSGRSIDEANTIALLLGFSKRGDDEKMYEWGEKIILQNMITYNSLLDELSKQSIILSGTRELEFLETMVNSIPYDTTTYYIETYINKPVAEGDPIIQSGYN